MTTTRYGRVVVVFEHLVECLHVCIFCLLLACETIKRRRAVLFEDDKNSQWGLDVMMVSVLSFELTMRTFPWLTLVFCQLNLQAVATWT